MSVLSNVFFVCDQDNSVAFVVQTLKERHDFVAGSGVEVAGRFIGEQNRRAVHQSASDRHALALTAGKLIGLVVHAVFQIDLRQSGLRLFNALGGRRTVVDQRKLARLGSVNMEALEELTRVETEFNSLRAQHEDLAAARKSLQDVIDTINGDSRKLFTQTLAAVRGYFQELFRKLFGGGQADIVLEDESDVLECGIEITARPPGKELTRISLLSGGERALTAVALLLAIFRSRPSPFCLLDEVDAAMDEANTTRLASLLREFCETSQFIVVTHKKRTMAVADVLYGVTMQESGVSKLVAVRFEDWPDENEKSEETAA